MENEHIIHGLMRKRADVAGEIAQVHDRLRALQNDLAHVEATLRMFQPDIDFSGARVSRKPGHLAADYGEMSKLVRDVLRQAPGFLTIKAISAKVREVRALGDDRETEKTVQKRVGTTLRNLKRREQAESRHSVGLAMEWRLADA